ncbi:MAG: ABC-F family ATP-binding cassette domain-containing protein [Flavobacteriaceae bacterium]|nr:ABC-F family ATP-binding cassette domain-containing protein [Flavobacteriaceae bacterium]
MLNIYNLSVAFQGSFLFQGITFQLNGGDRVGLVGKNGAGKSTLLKIISGDQEYDKGQIATDKEISVGFLRQDIDFVQGRNVLEESYQAFEQIKSLELQLDQINHDLATRTDYESDGYTELIERLSDVQNQYEIHGGYNYQGDTERILLGLGFKRSDFEKQTDTFSGGWRMRIELAKLLLQNHDVLLLDEPTNHLDIESILWLEEFLKAFSGAVVLVSHDRMFLDQVTNRTIEISLGRIYDIPKSYSKYLVARNELRGQQLAAQKNQQKQIDQTAKLIEKFRAKASKATMAQSLIKKLDKIDRIEVDEDDNSVMTLRFPLSKTPGKVVAVVERASKNYGDHVVLNEIDLRIDRDSKTAFVGQNGQGKSTLAKMIVGELKHQGSIILGHNVEIGYFAQNQAEYLEGSKTVEETMIDAADERTRPRVRDILGAFLFRGEEVDKYVRVLSGGERNRLALAKLLLQPFNVLVMDEPTNHLDIKSKNVLKEALLNFQGTLIVVSHDRDFLQGLTNVVYEFKDSTIRQYLGDIDYFLEQRNISHLRDAERRTVPDKLSKQKPASTQHDPDRQKELKFLQNRLSKLEVKVSKVEKELKDMDKALALNYEKTTADGDFYKKYESKKTSLKDLMGQWEEASLKLEKHSRI